MNPNARTFSFNPAAQGFLPPQVAAQMAAQQQAQGGGQQQDGQGAANAGYSQQSQYPQGGYGGYNQPYGGADAYGQQPFYGGGAGYGAYEQPSRQQAQQAPSQDIDNTSASRTGGLPPRPDAADPNRKPVVMSLGGSGGAAPSSGSTPGVSDKKPVSVSLGALKANTVNTKPVSISIGGASSTANKPAAQSDGARAPVSQPDNSADNAAAPVAETAAKPATAPDASAVDSKSGNAQGAGLAAKKAAKIDQKVEKSQTDAQKILEEASKVTDEETLRDLFGDKVDDLKSHLNIVFVGHVDAGKSTMGGQILHLTGMVDKRTLEKYEKEAKDAGRETWYLSWALDSTPQERAKGKTVEVGRAYFETGNRRYTILDAPGHKTYVPSMISGAAQADIACLVISARKGEFETGFERGGQSREHVMLVKTAGVQRLVVVINKMDDPTVEWQQSRFDEIVGKLTPFLKGSGFNPKTDVAFVPVSAYTGSNIKEPVPKDVCSWYNGPPLLTYLDTINLGDRKISEPLKMPISEKYSDMGTVVVGKLESGKVRKGDSLLLMPNRSSVEVTAIYGESDEEVPAAISGDNVRIKIKGVDHEDVSVGFVLTDPNKPVNTVTRFEAQLAILEHRNIICAGYSAVMHIHTASEEITLQALLHYYDKKTGKKSRKPPQFAKRGMKIVALIETSAPVCLERFVDYPQLGRFTVRDEGRTIGIGKVTKLSPVVSEMPDLQKLAVSDTAAQPGSTA